jgi:hypothetical protein
MPKKNRTRLTPHRAEKGRAWWYEDEKGIDVYLHVRGTGTVDHARIPWARLIQAAKRAGYAK